MIELVVTDKMSIHWDVTVYNVYIEYNVHLLIHIWYLKGVAWLNG